MNITFKGANRHKGIEFLSQTLIFLTLYLRILMPETLDISNYNYIISNDNRLNSTIRLQRYSDLKIRICG